MFIFDRILALLALLTILAAMPPCIPIGPPTGNYKVNTFEFTLSNTSKNDGECIPNISIDTNLRLSGLAGGTLTSSLPCGVNFDYTDNTFSLKSAVISSVTITYDDNSVDPSTEKLKLPLSIPAREYESVNSVAGGRIVTSKASIISTKIPNLISRKESFRLQIQGFFNKHSGTKHSDTKHSEIRIPFTMDQHFDIKSEVSNKSAAELLQDK